MEFWLIFFQINYTFILMEFVENNETFPTLSKKLGKQFYNKLIQQVINTSKYIKLFDFLTLRVIHGVSYYIY